jgi:hypothetical protein
MDKVIVGYVDSMGFNQKIQLPGGEEMFIPSDSYAESLVALCNKEQTFKLHLFGNVHYLEGVIEEIERKEKELFSQNNIEIEVN